MKTKSFLFYLLIVAVAVAPLAFLAIIWPEVPQRVPLHYDINFRPDRVGDKKMLWLMNGSLSVVAVLVYFLLTNLYRFDPKRAAKGPSLPFSRIAAVVLAFITIINFITLLSVNRSITLSPKLLFALAALLLAFLGNYFNNIKPNYFAGLRLPWTLSSDYNWKKTHQVAGKLWFWSGLVLFIIILIVPPVYTAPTFFFWLGIILLIPVIYSYRLFKQHKASQ